MTTRSSILDHDVLVSRRTFLTGAGAVSLLATQPLASPLRLVTPARKKVLVTVFLRGGMDGLHLVVPHADPAYADLRSYLAIPAPGTRDGALDLDGFFGLHPALSALAPRFEEGSAVALHAVGSPGNTRSHFEEQDTWETGRLVESSGARNQRHGDGWLNRWMAQAGASSPVRAVSFSDNLPLLLRGAQPSIAVRGLGDFANPGDASLAAQLARAYKKEQEQQDEMSTRRAATRLIRDRGEETLAALSVLEDVARNAAETEVEYPNTPFSQRLRDVARLVRADVGLELAQVDLGGWDTHRGQGAARGAFGNLARQLGDGLAAFLEDLGERREDVLVLAFSEFGRTARLNGTGGTDHGWGNAMLALGGPIAAARDSRPGPVLGSWPGLAREQLRDNRDLAHTTDFRDVFAEALGHLGGARAELFAGRPGAPVGLLGAAAATEEAAGASKG